MINICVYCILLLEENFWEPSCVLETLLGILYTLNLICLHYLSPLSCLMQDSYSLSHFGDMVLGDTAIDRANIWSSLISGKDYAVKWRDPIMNRKQGNSWGWWIWLLPWLWWWFSQFYICSFLVSQLYLNTAVLKICAQTSQETFYYKIRKINKKLKLV